MKKPAIWTAVLFVVFVGTASSFGQTVSDEAKRHFDRGVAAADMAKEPADYEAAIREFELAASLAPGWPDVFYNLGLVQEAAEKYAEAIWSLRRYIQLAPNADDVEEIKSRLISLEDKVGHVLTVPEIIDVLVDFSRWRRTQSGTFHSRGVFRMISFQRAGADSVQVVRSMQMDLPYDAPDSQVYQYQTLAVTSPVLKYTIMLNENGGDFVIENEVDVVSGHLVRVHQRVLRRGESSRAAETPVSSLISPGAENSFTFER